MTHAEPVNNADALREILALGPEFHAVDLGPGQSKIILRRNPLRGRHATLSTLEVMHWPGTKYIYLVGGIQDRRKDSQPPVLWMLVQQLEMDSFRRAPSTATRGIELEIDSLIVTGRLLQKSLKGWLWKKRFYAVYKTSLCAFMHDFSKWLLEKFSGYRLKVDVFIEVQKQFDGGFSLEDIVATRTDSKSEIEPNDRKWELFGYRGTPEVLLGFCIFLLTSFFILHFTVGIWNWLRIIASNPFLGAAACIVSITIWEFYFHRTMLACMNGIVWLRKNSEILNGIQITRQDGPDA